ncbi:hypothetical protein Fmac_032280 [Flemingia macrophylla]|uniref:Uncharacterized protein n=1 Tax=Flemingia macrophylla TaxID=520843 RepID=A0ABD1L4H9_9FABA
MGKSWVAKLHHMQDFERLRDLKMLHASDKLSLRYLGDDMVLLSGLEEDEIPQGEEEGVGWSGRSDPVIIIREMGRG